MNMKKVIASKIIPVACATFFAVMASGCGDDSSNSSPAAPATPETQEPASSAEVPASSAAEPVPVSSATGDVGTAPVPESSSAVESSADAGNPVVTPVANTFNRDPAAANLALAPDAAGFYDIGDIYKAVPAESKIVFVLRHAERESGLGQESPLTEVGEQQAIDAGKKLAGGDASFYYASTDFIRTQKTAANIAAGRGETAEVVTWDAINGGYFLAVPSDTLDALVSKRGGSLKYVSQWAYGVPFSGNSYVISHGIETYFYDLFVRGDQFINEVILANLPNWKRVNILISHDLLLEPLAVYASNRTVDLKTYESHLWINYLAGIAVIVDPSGMVTLLPARGTESGALNTREAYGSN